MANAPNGAKGNWPDSDQTARDKHPYAGQEAIEDASTDTEGLQTSNKSGKHSSAEKLAASRPEFGEGRGAHPVPGAFGHDEGHRMTGRDAGPGTNQFRCSSCGRYLNSAQELAAHETECNLAKVSTSSGQESLHQDQNRPHPPNDTDSKQNRFQHGTKQP